MTIGIEQMKSEIEKLDKKRYKLRDRLEAAEIKKALPALKKKYEGKFFMYKNTWGGDDVWPLYVHVRKVKDMHYFWGDQFQIDPRGEAEFYVNKELSYSLLSGDEITAKEYVAARKKFISYAKKLSITNL